MINCECVSQLHFTINGSRYLVAHFRPNFRNHPGWSPNSLTGTNQFGTDGRIIWGWKIYWWKSMGENHSKSSSNDYEKTNSLHKCLPFHGSDSFLGYGLSAQRIHYRTPTAR